MRIPTANVVGMCHIIGIVGTWRRLYLCTRFQNTNKNATKNMKKVSILLLATATVLTLASCNSNDDENGISIEGITITDDVECCTAEEALDVYNFLQTLKEVPELATSVADKYDVKAYTPTGGFHTGYNDLYYVVTKKATGNYVKYVTIEEFAPLMHMVKMNMYHSTPISEKVASFSLKYHAVLHGWVSLLMPTSEAGDWALSYTIDVLGSKAQIEGQAFTVDALPEGQEWLKSFKVGDETFYLSLVNPNDWKVGTNEILAYVSKQATPRTQPYGIAAETFTIEIDPRMPDMGNHSSPNNVALTKRVDNAYRGSINLTMTGLWRIHLTVKDKDGNVVAGGDKLKDGFSSLYWDVTL